MHRLLLTTALATAPLVLASTATAQCVPSVTEPNVIACSGTDPDGFVFPTLDDINLLISLGATVTNAPGSRAIDLDDRNVVVVNGLVASTDADAIRVDNDGSIRLTTNGRITAEGDNADAIDAGNRLILRNVGRIEAGKDGVNAGNDANIDNDVNGRIVAGDDGLQVGDRARIVNRGTIRAQGEGVNAENDLRLTNHGRIEALDDAVKAGENAFVENFRTISNFQSADDVARMGEAQDGIDIDSGTIINAMGAFITSTFGDAIDFDPSTLDIVSVIDNRGTIQGGNRAVETDPVNTSAQHVINRSTGRIIGGSGLAMNLGAGNDIYTHYTFATLTGGIDFGTGDDLLEIIGTPTGSLGGPGAVIDGGAGFDTASLRGFMFDQIAGTVLGPMTLDLRLGDGPDPLVLTLANFDAFLFGDRETAYSFAEVAARLRDPSVVPLPASALLMLAGLGGLAALRRRVA